MIQKMRSIINWFWRQDYKTPAIFKLRDVESSIIRVHLEWTLMRCDVVIISIFDLSTSFCLQNVRIKRGGISNFDIESTYQKFSLLWTLPPPPPLNRASNDEEWVGDNESCKFLSNSLKWMCHRQRLRTISCR